MPAGYSAKCKTCNSSLRTEIEAWHVKDGMDFIAISLKLKGKGIEISDRALSAHFNNHYNVQTEAREQYHKSQEQLVEDAKAQLTDLQILDELIQDGHIIHAGLSKQIKELKDKFSVPLPAVTMLNGAATEICRAIKTKQELLGEDPESKKADSMASWDDTGLAILMAVDNDPEAKAKIITALEQRRRSSVSARSSDLGEGGSRA